MTAHENPWTTMSLLRSPDGMLAHARPSCANMPISHPVYTTDSHLAGHNFTHKQTPITPVVALCACNAPNQPVGDIENA
jgi:hypothetical protein